MVKSETEKFPWAAMFAIGFTVFATVTSEFLPTGMLPSMSADLGVSTSQIGFLVSVWAATVVLTAIPLSLTTRRFSRKSILVIAVALFTVSNVMASFAPNYEVLVVSRIVGGLGNGMFWMIATGYVTTMLPSKWRSRGFLFISAGANLAFIAGLPLGSALAAVSDWRTGFLIMTALTIGASVSLYFLLIPVPNPHTADSRGTHSTVRDSTFPMVLLGVSGVFLVVGGGNIFYPYIAPFLIEVSNFTPLTVAAPLAAYGIGGTIGILVAERLGRRAENLSRNIALSILYMAAMMVILNLVAPSPIAATIAVALWSLGFAVTEPLFGQYIMELSSPRLRDFAGAMRTTAWNLGIGGGSFVGGLLLVPLGLAALPYIGASVLVAGSTVALVARRRETALLEP
ncbi:MAG: MFS transporter [Microbacteriaceae bacterium]